MGVMKPSLILFSKEQDKKSLEQSASLEEIYILKTFGKSSLRKVRSEWKLGAQGISTK